MAAVKGALVLAVMERLMLTRPSHWLEVRTSHRRPPTTHVTSIAPVARAHRVDMLLRPQEHLDYLSMQALMFKHASLGAAAQVRLMFHNTRRLTE
jgi:hypothetical protein